MSNILFETRTTKSSVCDLSDTRLLLHFVVINTAVSRVYPRAVRLSIIKKKKKKKMPLVTWGQYMVQRNRIAQHWASGYVRQ